ncbi:DUF1295-domain-containing protein [Mycena metata]|uniref:DUF1295-domain-containing protein n=1 Tax=Mycena metata TaxID=1033252 RepID=A0AAD7N3Q2_9AGAR|nr:DUF1295-domain-containing protein [Mycena metata]
MLVHVLDPLFLSLTILITAGYQLSGFAIAYTFQFDKITDLTGGSNFFILALVTLLVGGSFHVRNVVTSVLVMIWAVRISGFLFFRVLMTGHDGRFDEIRKHFFRFLAFWIGQILWVWVVSLPLVILNSPAVSDVTHGGSNPPFGTSRDIAGLVLWALGFFIESIADVQKYLYKSSKTTHKDKPISAGLWAWSRHPPYFGEIMCWWGIWILCLSPTADGTLSSSSRAAQYGAITSPIFTVIILMFGSGVPMAAKPQAKRFYLKSYGPATQTNDPVIWDQYKVFLRETSILIPIPPVLYRNLPSIVKKTVLFDFPMFQFDELKDGPTAIEEARKELDHKP